MKVTFNKTDLIAAVAPAAGISQIKNTLTSIEGLLFECPPDPKMGDFDGPAENVCRISAFDLEKGLRTSVECNIYEEGKYVISGSKILQIIRALPDGEITLTIDKSLRAVISGGNSSFEISVAPGEDFPSMPMFKGDRRYQIPQHMLRKMINETIFSAAVNDQRAYLNGELLKISGGKMTMVACDSSRLSCISAEASADVPDCEIIIPGKFLSELSRMLKDSEDEATMIIGNKHIIFKMNEVYFFCRMIESKYLDYTRVIPRSFETVAYVDPDEMKGAIERASIISEDKLGGNSKAQVKFVVAGNKIDISAVSTSGSIFETVGAAITGEEVTIGFNCRYLYDALKAVPDGVNRIRIGFNGSFNGVCIEPSYGTDFISTEINTDENVPEGEEKQNFLHLVMPRRR